MNCVQPTIRDEQPGDEAGIRAVVTSAFPTDAEARLVDALRQANRLAVSLVACVENEVVGHLAFSPVELRGRVCGVGLAPIAVLPIHQRRGIGKALIRAGLDRCRRLGKPFVVVLGDPAYYCQFGFRPAAAWNLVDTFHGGSAFQALELIAESLGRRGGVVRYAEEFSIFQSDSTDEAL